MPAPANDDRSDAEVVPDLDTLYWGVVTGGTTIDATDEDAGPLHDVWYTWTDLPEGNVYIYLEPRPGATTDLQYRARLYSAAPADADFSDPFTQGGGTVGDPSDTLRIHHWHIGGPVALQVFTNTEDEIVGDIDFDFGWGHDLDADASHWGATTQDDWANTLTEGIDNAEGQLTTPSRKGHGSTFVEVPGTSVPPPGDADCAWSNARDGVDQTPTVDAGDPDNCDYAGPAGGTFGDGFVSVQNVGASWAGLAAGGDLPPPAPPSTPGTDRQDHFSASQFMWFWRWGDAHHGTITVDDTLAGTPANERQFTPVTFPAYQAGVDPKLAWGYDYTEPMVWDTRDFRLTGAPSLVTNAPAADHFESPSVVARFVTSAVSNLSDPDAAAFDDPSLTPDAAYFHGGPGVMDVEASYVTNDVAGVGDTLATMPVDATTPVDVVLAADEAGLAALMTESAADVDGPRWLIAVVVDDLVVADTPPTVYTPARGVSLSPGDPTITDRSQQFTGGSPLLNWDFRLPQWRPYRGFPLNPVSSGWRVGRVAAGANPW